MDGIKVREVSGDEQKSSQQIEQELLAKHEENVERIAIRIYPKMYRLFLNLNRILEEVLKILLN